MKLRRGWIVAAAVAVAGAGALAWWGRSRSLEVVYREVHPSYGEIAVTILSTGVVQPDNRLEIKPPIAGRIETVQIQEGAKVRKGQILAWMSSTERAALLDAARARGPEEVKRWEELYKPTPILAPISGTIILRSVEPGQTFTNQDSVFVMSDRLTIKAQVDETDIAQVKLGQAASVTLDAYPREVIPAKVDQIAFDAKTVNNVTTYVVDVLPERTPEFMRSGMTANVTFQVDSRPRALLLPSDAIKAEEGRFFVLVAAPGGGRGKAERRPVETGLTDGKRIEITRGLTEQDTVLIAQFKADSERPRGGTNPLSPMGSRRGGSGGGGGGGGRGGGR